MNLITICPTPFGLWEKLDVYAVSGHARKRRVSHVDRSVVVCNLRVSSDPTEGKYIYKYSFPAREFGDLWLALVGIVSPYNTNAIRHRGLSPDSSHQFLIQSDSHDAWRCRVFSCLRPCRVTLILLTPETTCPWLG